MVYPPMGSMAKDREMSAHAYAPSGHGTIYLPFEALTLGGGMATLPSPSLVMYGINWSSGGWVGFQQHHHVGGTAQPLSKLCIVTSIHDSCKWTEANRTDLSLSSLSLSLSLSLRFNGHFSR